MECGLFRRRAELALAGLIAVSQQAGLVMAMKMIPRHGDEIGAALDIQQPIAAVGEIAMIDPNLLRSLDADGVAGFRDGQVPDHDIADLAQVDPAADELRIGANANERRIGPDPQIARESDLALMRMIFASPDLTSFDSSSPDETSVVGPPAPPRVASPAAAQPIGPPCSGGESACPADARRRAIRNGGNESRIVS